jgi:hypothetical protein
LFHECAPAARTDRSRGVVPVSASGAAIKKKLLGEPASEEEFVVVIEFTIGESVHQLMIANVYQLA